MDKVYNEGNAVIGGEENLFLAKTKNLFEPILQRTLTPEDCEKLIVQFTDFGMFIREVVLNKITQKTADNGEPASE